MEKERLLPVSALIEAMGVALKKLVVDEKVHNDIMQEVAGSIEHVLNRPRKIAFLKGKVVDECIAVENVAWLEADGSYTKFHCIDGRTHMLTANLVSALRQLVANGWDCFVRIHKSYAVNIHHIRSKIGNVSQVGKADLAVSRAYREFFEKHIFSLRKLG